MSDSTPFSQFIDNDDPHFNEIWNENTGIREKETKEESQPGSISIKLRPSDPKSILKPRRAKAKITISNIAVEDQSVISTISRSSLSSYYSSLNMTTVLLDSPIDRDLSEITVLPIEKKRSCENPLERKFFHLYDSFGGEKAFKMSSCISEEAVQQNQAHIPTLCADSLCAESEDKVDKTVEASKIDDIQADSNQEVLLSVENLAPVENFPPPGAEQENVERSIFDISTCDSTPKLVAHKISVARKTVFASNGITSIPELLATRASLCLSSSLNVDDDVSKVSILAVDEKDGQGVAETIGAIATPSGPKLSVTREEKRLDKRSLLDSLLHKITFKEPQSSDAEEDENVTEGLGLTLPPVSQPSAPLTFSIEDPKYANLSTIIEVDETGKIVIDEVDSSDSVSHHQEGDSSIRDVYISYRIEGYQSDDTVSLSYSQDSESSDTPQVIPTKQNSGLRSFLKSGKRFFSGNKDKNNGGTRTIRKKPIKMKKSIYDSPGSDTVKTAGMTATDDTVFMTARTYATLHFGDDHPVHPRKHPFLRRSKTAKA